MALNPWRVQSIDEFNFFCCPECVYRSKEENSFQTHALQNHELSSTFFHHADDPKAIETGIILLIDQVAAVIVLQKIKCCKMFFFRDFLTFSLSIRLYLFL